VRPAGEIVEDEIRFWNGSKIYLCHCKDEKDIYKYQGAEIHVLLIDELTHFTETMYRFLRNRVRMVGINLPRAYEGCSRASCAARTRATSATCGSRHLHRSGASRSIRGSARRRRRDAAPVHPGPARRQPEHGRGRSRL
jgi:hypothetical protein